MARIIIPATAKKAAIHSHLHFGDSLLVKFSIQLITLFFFVKVKQFYSCLYADASVY